MSSGPRTSEPRKTEPVSHDDLLRSQDALGLKLEELIEAVGKEKVGENGQRIGTGLTGRVMAVERRDQAEQTLKDRVVSWAQGGLFIGALGLAAIWWLVRPAVEEMFHRSPTSPVPAHAPRVP